MLKKVSIANLGFALASAPLLHYITSASGQGGKGSVMSALLITFGGATTGGLAWATGTYALNIWSVPGKEALRIETPTLTGGVASTEVYPETIQPSSPSLALALALARARARARAQTLAAAFLLSTRCSGSTLAGRRVTTPSRPSRPRATSARARWRARPLWPASLSLSLSARPVGRGWLPLAAAPGALWCWPSLLGAALAEHWWALSST